MAIRKYAGDKITGLSSDTKPTNVSDGATFYETDTNKIYIKVSGSWVESTSTTANLALATAQSAFAQANTGGDISPAFNQANLALATAQSAFAQANTGGGSSSSFTSNVVISVADDTNAALRITQTGTADAIRIEDDTNPDSTPFIVDANGRVGIGTASPVSSLTVDNGFITTGRYQNGGTVVLRSANGTQALPNAISISSTLGSIVFRGYDGSVYRDGATITAYSDGAFSNTSTPSYLEFRTASSGSIGTTERMRIDSSGNVGIGTSSPTRSLSVLTAANPVAQFQGGASAYVDVTDGTGTLRLQSTSAASYLTAVTNIPMIINTNNTERVRIDATGNVGIGTGTPLYRLDVRGTTDLGSSIRATHAGTGASNLAVMAVATGSSVQGSLIAQGNQNVLLGSDTNHPLVFRTNATERMTISTSGSIGIGTSTPLYGIDVRQNSTFGSIISANNTGTGSLNIAAFTLATGRGMSGSFLALGNAYMSIGTDTPHPFLIESNNALRMIFTATGNVGIDKSDPQYRLDVANGDINITGNILKSGLLYLFDFANVVTLESGTTYTPVSNVLSAIVIATGAGGGGGGSDSDGSGAAGGSGGGAGGTAIRAYTKAELGASVTYSIGTRGSGGSNGGGNGTAGGNTTFTPAGTGTALNAVGGALGTGNNGANDNTRTAGGLGGTSTGGQLNIDGGDGIDGITASSGSTGGVPTAIGGSGGASFWGGGGSGSAVPTASAGVAGVGARAYGAGGGGSATSDNTTGAIGGTGANGVIFILEFQG